MRENSFFLSIKKYIYDFNGIFKKLIRFSKPLKWCQFIILNMNWYKNKINYNMIDSNKYLSTKTIETKKKIINPTFKLFIFIN